MRNHRHAELVSVSPHFHFFQGVAGQARNDVALLRPLQKTFAPFAFKIYFHFL